MLMEITVHSGLPGYIGTLTHLAFMLSHLISYLKGNWPLTCADAHLSVHLQS